MRIGSSAIAIALWLESRRNNKKAGLAFAIRLIALNVIGELFVCAARRSAPERNIADAPPDFEPTVSYVIDIREDLVEKKTNTLAPGNPASTCQDGVYWREYPPRDAEQAQLPAS